MKTMTSQIDQNKVFTIPEIKLEKLRANVPQFAIKVALGTNDGSIMLLSKYYI